jgi:murein DD-endopeptidase MepM/ murein hydrolase activator NlpD
MRQTGIDANALPTAIAGDGSDRNRAFDLGSSDALTPRALTLDGTSPDAAGLPAMASLLAARVTSSYGWRRDPIDGAMRLHKGTDLAMAHGQEVPAARAGAVAFAGELPGYGLTVLINHDAGRATRYAHLSELMVKAGDVVAEGQVVARSGASGRATGPHLHFELLEHGQPVDPAGRLGLLGTAIQISD